MDYQNILSNEFRNIDVIKVNITNGLNIKIFRI